MGVENTDYNIHEHEQYVNIAVHEAYISNENTLFTQNNVLLCRF